MKRAIIVDDEQPAVNKLLKMLPEKENISVIGTFTDPQEAYNFSQTHTADIAFLDIEMPGMDGFELANLLLELNNQINIIFVTAYSEYAVEAFRLNALDYLLKPVEKERLDLALKRIPYGPDTTVNKADIVKVTCFGKFKVTVGGEPLKFRTAKAEEMFAYLIDKNGKPVHRNHILDVFWMDYDGDRGAVLFNTTLYYLKKAILQKGVQIKIECSRGTYQLDLNKIQCDSAEFANRAARLQPVSDKTIKEYEDVMALYTGDYFEQNDYIWSTQKRMKLKEKYAEILLAVSNFYVKQGNAQKAIELLKTGLSRDPLNKVLNYDLLKKLKSKNDTVALIKYYEIYKKRLANELGMEPDHDFKNLMKVYIR